MADGSGETAQQYVAGTGQKPPKAAPRIIEKKQNASRLRLHVAAEELYPEDYALLKQDEEILGFTLDNKCDLDTFVGDAESCVYHGDLAAIHSLVTGEFTVDDVYVKGNWMYPAGAFHGAEGGPC